MKSFLTSRRQFTTVEGCTSVPAEIGAGVPQGAILSPLLFSVYVNDLSSTTPARNILKRQSSSPFCFELRPANYCGLFVELVQLLTSINSPSQDSLYGLALNGNAPLPAEHQNERQQEPLIAVEPRRPPKTNEGTETAFDSETTIASISKKVNVS